MPSAVSFSYASTQIETSLPVPIKMTSGEPLEEGGLIVTSDKTVTDGPFPESKEMVGGYIRIEAESIEAASEVAKDCPVLNFGGRVEVRQIAIIEHTSPTP